MFKRVCLMLVLLIVVPVMASAYNYWSVTKATSPSIAILQNAVTATAPTTGLSVVGVKTYATAAIRPSGHRDDLHRGPAGRLRGHPGAARQRSDSR